MEEILMKKKLAAMMTAILALVLALTLAACGGGADWAWKPGADSTTYEVSGHGPYAPTYTVYVKIQAGDDVLYDGTVTLTSDDMWANEFTSAALSEKGLAQEGLSAGFVTKIGDYENKDIDGEYMYWSWSVNGVPGNWGCNQYRLVDGMYLKWEYIASTF